MNALIGVGPLLIVALGAILLMIAEAAGHPQSVEGSQKSPPDAGSGRGGEMGLLAGIVLLAGAAVSVGVALAHPQGIEGPLAPYLMADQFSWLFSGIICVVGALCAFQGAVYLPEHRIDRSEFFPLLLWATIGGLALVSAGDFLSLFIALETLSLGTYCLAGLRRTARSFEAALKYFLLGSFAAALLLFGGALLYGATGHTDFIGIGAAISGGLDSARSGMVLFGTALVLVGLMFKVAVVPFHAWTPDAYEGAPTPATSFMASVVKLAAFGVTLRVLHAAFGGEALANWGAGWPPILAALAVITMTFANVVAGRQSSVKRMLAYSSIAHAGYALVGVVATLRSSDAQASVIAYLLTYAISTVGAFGALMLAGSYQREATSYEDLAGLGRRYPAPALAFSLFLLSLAGIPGTAGFFGKLFVFKAAMEADLALLVVIALVNSLIGAYYYLKVMVFMYMRDPEPEAQIATPLRSPMMTVALVFAAGLVLWIGVLPSTTVEVVQAAVLRR
ncbi:MAG TPA: NADH-quinone oxidoreductase subunit N [Polyangiaceae bacterium]|nr:NADH-quinone oxidoreductase subunit N [Polyangiaceae bacterium]